MTRNFPLPLAMLLALPTLLSGCTLFGGSTCSQYCNYLADCTLDLLDDGGQDCDWEDDDREARKQCMDACQDSWAKLNGDEKTEVRICVDCVQDDVDGSCDLDEYNDAIGDCDDDCEEDGVLDWSEEFWEEFDLPDLLDCKEPTGYTNSYSYGY